MSSEVAVGDLTSDKRGSGARMNGDKVPVHYIPVDLWLQMWKGSEVLRQDDMFKLSLHRLAAAEKGQDSFSQALRCIPTVSVDAACRVFHYGAEKYAAWNWLKGMPWSVAIGCAVRHARAIIERGEDVDPESGLPHIGHYVCNLIMLASYERWYPGGNDLPNPKYFTTGE